MGAALFFTSQSKLTALQPPAGMALWIKGGTVLYDGSNYIYKAPDGSGGTNDATQATAINQPLRVAGALNGKDVIRFDGSSDFMTGTMIPNINTSSLDIFIVANGASKSGSAYDMLFGIGDYTNGLWIARQQDQQSLYVYNNEGVAYSDPGSLKNTGFGYKIFELWKNNGVSSKILFNNIQQATAVFGSFTNAPYYIGYGGFPYQGYYKGDIAEILLYPSALNDADRAQAGAYLQQQYGIPYIVNKIPTMTSDTAPSGIVTYGHSVPGYEGFKAFDGNEATFWNAGVNPNTFLCYELPVPAKFESYYLKTYPGYEPTDWTIQGYDGSNWVVLDTQTGQSSVYGNTYMLSNTGLYAKYKMVITAAANNNPAIYTLMYS